MRPWSYRGKWLVVESWGVLEASLAAETRDFHQLKGLLEDRKHSTVSRWLVETRKKKIEEMF